MLALALVSVASVASLFGPSEVARIVGSSWFVSVTALATLASLAAAVIAPGRRGWANMLLHAGFVVSLAGVAVNQIVPRSGYLFLEQAAGGVSFYLDRDLRRIDDLPFTVALDSLAGYSARGFQPAMLAWVSATAGERKLVQPVTYNRPLTLAGRQLIFARMVEPGFLLDYELAVGNEQYLLMHNQVARPEGGPEIRSFGYDVETRRVGLMVGGVEQWLSTGQSAVVGDELLALESADFAAGPGVIMVISDIRFRFIIFAGFAIVLLGLLPPLFKREHR